MVPNWPNRPCPTPSPRLIVLERNGADRGKPLAAGWPGVAIAGWPIPPVKLRPGLCVAGRSERMEDDHPTRSWPGGLKPGKSGVQCLLEVLTWRDHGKFITCLLQPRDELTRAIRYVIAAMDLTQQGRPIAALKGCGPPCDLEVVRAVTGAASISALDFPYAASIMEASGSDVQPTGASWRKHRPGTPEEPAYRQSEAGVLRCGAAKRRLWTCHS